MRQCYGVEAMSIDYETLDISPELTKAFQDYEHFQRAEKHVRMVKPENETRQKIHTAFVGIRLGIQILKQYGYHLRKI